MTLAPLHDQLTPRDIALQEIYLDPNNPRFVGLSSVNVPDSDITNPTVQADALSMLEKQFAVDRIRMNMEINGYLPIDRVIVRPIGDDSYVVLEGNRRIAAAKTLPSHTQDGNIIDPRVRQSVTLIPCLVYTGEDQSAAWLFQGIRHISGINDWSSYNKARLLVEQMEREQLSLTTAGRRFGLTAFGAGQWVRGYYAFKQAKEQTDYVSEIDERIYPYLQELFGRSSINVRDWLGWDEPKRHFRNADLFNEFVGWFYPRDKEDDGGGSSLGSWEKRKISKQDDIRQLAYLIQHSPRNFQLFREQLDLEAAYGRAVVEQYEKNQADVDLSQAVFSSLDQSIRALRDIPLAMIRDRTLREQLEEKLSFLEQAIAFVRE